VTDPADQAPPQSIEMEQATLGSVLIDGSDPAACRRTMESVIAAGLVSADFWRPEYADIWRAMVDLYDHAEPIDLLTLETRLRESGVWEKLEVLKGGSRAHLIQLTEACPAAASAAYYAERVREMSLRRQMQARSRTIIQLAQSEEWESLVGMNGALNVGELLADVGGEAARPVALDAGAFLAKVGEPPPMLVEGLLPERSLIILSGKPKFGKSLACMDMAASIAAGHLVWGQYRVNRKGAVLSIDMENSIYQIANRLIKRGVKRDEETGLAIVSAYFNLNKPGGMEHLRRLVKATNPVLVVIDSAREALGILDWNDAGEVTMKMRQLRDFAHEVCSVLLIAHNRKAESVDAGDEISGSNAFIGAADGFLSAWKGEQLADKHLRLHLRLRGRDDMLGEVCIQMSPENLHWRALTGKELADAQAQVEREQQQEEKQRQVWRIADVLREEGPATRDAIAEAAGLHPMMTWRRLQDMVKRGAVTQRELPAAGRGRGTVIYELISDFNFNESIGVSPKLKSENNPSDEPAEEF
jgi:hypothetical protein